MASKKIEVEITATDKASSKLEKVEKQADKLEADPIDIDLNVDTAALDRAESKAGGLASSLGGPGGAAAGAVALTAGLFAAADAAANMAIDAQVTADLTGATVEDASRLQVVWKQTGADVNDLNDILLNMNGVLADSPELADQLGVNLDDGATGVGRLLGLLEKLNTSQLSANEKARIMGQLFGEEGVRQIQKLLVMFPELEQAMADVNDSQVIDEEQVERMRKFSAETSELKAQFASWAATISSYVTPSISGFFKELNDGADSLSRETIELGLGEAAFRDFDMALLDGLTTWDQVRAKVIELTGSYHAANLVAMAWLGTTKDLNTELGSSNFGHAPAAGLAGIQQTNADRRAAATSASQVTIINPPGTPAATFDQLGTFLTRNSARTEG